LNYAGENDKYYYIKASYCKIRDFIVELKSKITMGLTSVIIVLGRSTIEYQLHDFEHQLMNLKLSPHEQRDNSAI